MRFAASALATMGLLSLLWSCVRGDKTPETPFTRIDDTWHYGDAVVDGADAATFRVLSEHYAVDARHAYFGDTFRKGQEYYTVKRFRVSAVEGADAHTFRLLRDNYARDDAAIYHKGQRLPVKDPASYEFTEWGLYTRDRLVAYFDDIEIEGSHGASFRALADHYAVDRAHVYYDNRVISTDPATFEVLESGAARTAAEYFEYGKRVKPPTP